MKILILGCGRTGTSLALQLSSAGHEVTIIDKKSDSFLRLGESHSVTTLLGNGLDVDVLEKGGAESADAFFAVTRGDNTNILAAQIMKRRFNMDRVCVKVADPLRADAYAKEGLFCINASSLMAGFSIDWLHSNEFKPIDAYNVLPKELEL